MLGSCPVSETSYRWRCHFYAAFLYNKRRKHSSPLFPRFWNSFLAIVRDNVVSPCLRRIEWLGDYRTILSGQESAFTLVDITLSVRHTLATDKYRLRRGVLFAHTIAAASDDNAHNFSAGSDRAHDSRPRKGLQWAPNIHR